MKACSVLIILVLITTLSFAQDGPINLAFNKPVAVSSVHQQHVATNAVDGMVSDTSRWLNSNSTDAWIEIDLQASYKLGGAHVYTGYGSSDPIEDFNLQFWGNGSWQDILSAQVVGNIYQGVSLSFDDNVDVTTDKIRVNVTKTPGGYARIREITIWEYSGEGVPELGTGVAGYEKEFKVKDIPKVFVNQSGYNTFKPKRFTAPISEENAQFYIRRMETKDTVYSGKMNGLIGDFSDFDPLFEEECEILVGDESSWPFSVGMWWLERVTYQLAIDFMIQSRHYVGNTSLVRNKSYAWRDDHHFAWTIRTLVPQFLSNPDAYLRMPKKVTYVPADNRKLWGALEPFDEEAPDIVKLMHWGADVILAQDLKHELFKTELAFFLYAWPYIEHWLPQQNYNAVLDFVKLNWERSTINRSYPHDKTPEHNLLTLKTKMGTTKGELPPGSSLQPNLMMFEVFKRAGSPDSTKYMEAAISQAKWMSENLDWEDSITTKGQRMSEHVTMTGMSFFLKQYPQYAPPTLKDDVEEWANIMIRRSNNMWDFRKLTDGINWTPFGNAATQWNEPGNVVGFPSCALAAMQVLEDSSIKARLYQLVYSHMDNCFGRNPTGRHFSYDGAREIEGVDLGWYSFLAGSVGLLDEVVFVLDGAPKNDHYPYHPEVGDVGWTEGWIQFNTAYNLSLAYMAHHDTKISHHRGNNSLQIALEVPLNFDYNAQEEVHVQSLNLKTGEKKTHVLKEMNVNSSTFSAHIPYPKGEVLFSYGYDYMGHSTTFVNKSPEVKAKKIEIHDLVDSGAIVGKIEASDYEGDQIWFFLLEESLEGVFKLDSTTGILSILDNQLLDAEKNERLDLKIAVTDSASPVQIVPITILVNEQLQNSLPIAQDQNFEISENPSLNSVVGTVQATDKDADSLSYMIVSGNEQGLFAINETTGEIITVHTGIDFETQNKHQLKVAISDGSPETIEILVTIQIKNVAEPITHIGDSKNTFTVYPNPTSGRFRIRASGTPKKTLVNLFNSKGQLVWQQSILGEQEIDLSMHAYGLYLLKIQRHADNSVEYHKLSFFPR